jgi:hypothetical protein
MRMMEIEATTRLCFVQSNKFLGRNEEFKVFPCNFSKYGSRGRRGKESASKIQRIVRGIQRDYSWMICQWEYL